VDNLTHSLTGALLGQAGLKRKTGLAMPALIIGANLPDVDAACFFWLDGAEHLGFRRGITHGPIAWVLLPLLLAGLLWLFDRWQTRRGKRPEGRLSVHFGWLYALSFIACLSHPALDWLNSYGIRLLEPFSSQWFYGDTLFIIDIWLWLGMGFATWFSLRREKQGREWMKPARIAMVVGLAYIGLNWAISATHGWHSASPHRDATETISSPLPIISFRREEISGSQNDWYYFHDSADVWVPFLKAGNRCVWPSERELMTGGSQSGAFLFWSRAPFAERAPDGSVLLRDARYYDPRARDRFTVALPDVKCEPIP